MNRRSFLSTASAAAAGLALPHLACAAESTNYRDDEFSVHFAPHLGMFRNLAGEDPLDQLRFMADRGFTAFEDNNMKTRDLATQEAMARVRSAPMLWIPWCRAIASEPNPAMVVSDESVIARPVLVPATSSSGVRPPTKCRIT